MFQLVLLLLGAQAIRRQWLFLAVIGTLWATLGVVIVVEAVEGIHDVTMHALGGLLVVEGLAILLTGLASGQPRRQLWMAKAMALVVPGLVIMETPLRNLALISILFGLALLADGCVRIVSTLLVRFPGWRLAIAGSAVEVVLAVLAITPWPVTYEDTVPFCVSVSLVLSGWTVLRSALLLRRLPPDAPISSLPIFEHQRGWRAMPLSVPAPGAPPEPAARDRLIVHVWTPVASSVDPLRRPLVDRYIAAVDRQGTVSTGHASLEMPPDLYISHYRASEEDRSRLEFRQALHAGVQNDVPGRFLPSYAGEVADWCEATEHVVFHQFNAARLAAFWDAYRQDSTYNLTNRNCSVVVALALDAALEGVLEQRMFWPPVLRMLTNPELHLATLLRKRARTMTWTPGLVLDYARALHRVVEPPTYWPVMLWRGISHCWRVRSHGAVAAKEPATWAAAPLPARRR